MLVRRMASHVSSPGMAARCTTASAPVIAEVSASSSRMSTCVNGSPGSFTSSRIGVQPRAARPPSACRRYVPTRPAAPVTTTVPLIDPPRRGLRLAPSFPIARARVPRRSVGLVDISQLLTESFSRVGEVLERAVGGLSVDDLTYRPDPAANTIAWLAWHAGRGQDAQIADVAGVEQVWTAQGWADRFDLPFDRAASGYGQSADEVAQVRASGELLLGYYGAVEKQTTAYLERLTDADLDVV